MASQYLLRAAAPFMGLLLLSSTAAAAVAPAIADTVIKQATPTVNAGGSVSLDIADGATALFRFDLSALPTGTPSTRVVKATGFFWVNTVTATGAVGIFSVADPWAERTVTFATAPYL